ncbi:MAG: DUF4962 domain-containing protein [Planctomycetota bacterium]
MMRTIFLSVIVLAILSAASSHAQPPPNLFRNPTFDTLDPKGVPAEWEYSDYKTGGKPVHAKCDRAGGMALGIQCKTEKERGSWRQSIAPGPAKALAIAGWYRTEGIGPKAQRGACIRVDFLKDPRKWDLISDKSFPLMPSNEWTAFEIVAPVPQGTKGVCVELFNFFEPGTVWWNDMNTHEASKEELRRVAAQRLDQPPQPNQIGYRPADGSRTSVNPPAFVWVPDPNIQSYIVQYAPEGRFDAPDCVTVRSVTMNQWIPRTTLKPGKWAWRYGYEGDGDIIVGKTRSFEIPEDAVAYPRPVVEDVMKRIPKDHPRVYLFGDRLKKVRAERETTYKPLVDEIVRGAEGVLKKNEPLFPEPKFLPKDDAQERSKAYLQSFKDMRPYTGNMQTCALAYLVTGERKYGEEAKKRLLHYSTWDVEGPTSVRNNDEAAMDIMMIGPRVYDWLHDMMSPAERKQASDMLRKRFNQMHQLHRRRPFQSNPYESHAGRMIGFMTEGCVIFAHEFEEVPEILDYYFDILWSVYPAWGGDDGGWAEGVGYWGGYMSRMTDYIYVLNDIGVPFKDKPFIQNTGYFGLYCAPPFSKVHPYGDGHEGPVNKGYGHMLYALSTLFRNPYFRWYADVMDSGPGAGYRGFAAFDPTLAAKPPTDLPQSRCFPHIGWVAMHSNLADPKNEVFLMLKSSPYGAISHSHACQNAFILNAFGEPLAISSGYYQRYGCPHHDGWTRETKAHCAITVDGQGQKKRDITCNGFIKDFFDSDKFSYACGDATAAYEGRLEKFERHIIFARPHYFVIFDDLCSAKESDYQWRLHALHEMSCDEEAAVVTIREGDARLRVEFLEPTGMKFSQTDKFDVPPEKPDSPNQWHFTASPSGKARDIRFVTVLLPYRAKDEKSLPTVSKAAAGGFAVAVAGEGWTDLVLWRTGDGPVKSGDVESTAQVAVVRRGADGGVLDCMTIAGSVRVGGKGIIKKQ